MNIELLKGQHVHIWKLVREIETVLNADNVNVGAIAFDLSLKIGQLSGALVLHLKSEDDYLYPELLKAESGEIRALAESFNQEMGSIAEKFTEYKRTYMLASKIKEQPEIFKQDTKRIFLALKNRLDKEDRKLYPLINK
jgi:hypothetical protein